MVFYLNAIQLDKDLGPSCLSAYYEDLAMVDEHHHHYQHQWQMLCSPSHQQHGLVFAVQGVVYCVFLALHDANTTKSQEVSIMWRPP